MHSPVVYIQSTQPETWTVLLSLSGPDPFYLRTPVVGDGLGNTSCLCWCLWLRLTNIPKS